MNSVIPVEVQPVRLTHSRHEKWGMTPDEYAAHVKKHGSTTTRTSPMSRYVCQRSGALFRGIEWQFDFKSWWTVWQKSGKWGKRGTRTGGYVMGRKGDGATPYSPDTVEIITGFQNIRDGHDNGREARSMKVKKGAGTGKGYSVMRTKGGVVTYAARFRHKFLGRYATEAEAHAVYRAAYLAALAASSHAAKP